MLLEIAREINDITIYDVNGFLEKAHEGSREDYKQHLLAKTGSVLLQLLKSSLGVSAKMLQTSRRGRGQQDDSKYVGNAGSEMLS
ncbi:hypothetical protein TNCV_4730031 [Trichonephila clavipes]|nr:hypothetical protein TNCV_4730031 [Trichonephila clavipes]